MYKKAYGHIANSRFTWEPKPGTGNKSTKGVTDAEKLRLTNVLIDRAGMDEFLNLLYDNGEAKMDITLSDRRTTRRWGSAFYMDRRVILYRHTVWVFLHEVAHVMDVHTSVFNSAQRVRTVKPHGPNFGFHLSRLYEVWMKFCDKGVENLPQTDTDMTIENQDNLYKCRFLEDSPHQVPQKWNVPERRPRLVGGISLQKGDTVWFMGKGRKITAEVIRVNNKTCRLKPLDGSNEWRVSPKLLHKVAGDVDIPITKDEYNGLKDAMAFDQPKPAPRKERSQADLDTLKAWKLKYRRHN